MAIRVSIVALCAFFWPLPATAQDAAAIQAIQRAQREASENDPLLAAGPSATKETLADLLKKIEAESGGRKKKPPRGTPPVAPAQPTIDLNAIKAGHIGILDVPLNSTAHGTDQARTFRVLQVLDENSMLATATWKSTLLWVSGYPTQDVADDSVVVLSGYWEVVGKRQYESTRGSSKTVFEIRHFDVTPYLPAKATTESKPPVLRTWSDASGTFTVKAEFRGLAAGKVKLRTEDGREIQVPLDRLSKADKEFITAKRP